MQVSKFTESGYMETGILIAIVSAAGVIGSSFLQWRSNIKTLDSTAASMKHESEQRTLQSIREADERRTIREEEREAEATRHKLEDQARWMAMRQELHEAAIAKLPELISSARLSVLQVESMRTIGATRGGRGTFLDKYVKESIEKYHSASDELLKMESKLDLYGSNQSSKAYSALISSLAQFFSSLDLLFLKTHPPKAQRVSDKQQREIQGHLENLQGVYQHYVAEARSDLRTDR